MLGFYIFSAIVGLAFILVSAFAGHHEGDFLNHDVGAGHVVGGHDVSTDAHGGLDHGHEVSHDTGHDTDHNMSWGVLSAWIPFLSIRFYTYFFAAFGIVGMVLVFLNRTHEAIIPWVAVLVGLICGTLVSTLFRLTQVSSSDSMTREKDILGCEAKVLVAVRPDQPGRVRCSIKGDVVDFIALPHDGSTLNPGEEAIIIAMENGKAMVIPKSQIFD